MNTTDTQPVNEFQSELADLINKYSLENASNTQDFVLAEFLIQSLGAFNYAVNYRRSVSNIQKPGTSEKLKLEETE